ncbi:MAG: hypothetical protein ABSF83_12370 [Nitrososphaerales archaeon]
MAEPSSFEREQFEANRRTYMQVVSSMSLQYAVFALTFVAILLALLFGPVPRQDLIFSYPAAIASLFPAATCFAWSIRYSRQLGQITANPLPPVGPDSFPAMKDYYHDLTEREMEKDRMGRALLSLIWDEGTTFLVAASIFAILVVLSLVIQH